ncbi:MAG: hypothetical protein M3Y50_02435 [Acidobacteriota bacterium]|nr:hypothetical protein [Acidobacteriota bacterium]
MRLPRGLLVSRVLGLGLILLVSATVLALEPDHVILKNGDRFTGRVVSTDAETLSLETEAAGVIRIRRALIERVSVGAGEAGSDEKAAVLEAEPAVRAVPPSVVTQEAVQVSANCMAGKKPVPETWAFSFQGAPNKVVLGTQSEVLFGGGLNVSLCEGSRRDTTNLAAQGSHARVYERGSAIAFDVAGAELQQQHFFGSPQGMAAYGLGEVFTNNSLGMAMEKSVGAGVLSPQFRHKTLFYDFAADVRYLNQHLDHHSPALNLGAARLREQMHLQGGIFTWNEQAWIMPAFNDVHALQAYASFGPSVTLKPWLHLGLNAEESYLGNAPRPNRKNYFSSAFSLTIQGGSGSRTK